MNDRHWRLTITATEAIHIPYPLVYCCISLFVSQADYFMKQYYITSDL